MGLLAGVVSTVTMPYNQYTGEYYDVTSRGTNDLVCLTVMLWSYNDSDNAGQPL